MTREATLFRFVVVDDERDEQACTNAIYRTANKLGDELGAAQLRPMTWRLWRQPKAIEILEQNELVAELADLYLALLSNNTAALVAITALIDADQYHGRTS